jgi:hypothetical protein
MGLRDEAQVPDDRGSGLPRSLLITSLVIHTISMGRPDAGEEVQLVCR